MSKYRFKTQEEFIRDGQWDDDNHCPEGWSQSGDMNHYLGEDVPEGANESCDLGESFDDDGWYFENTNYVLIDSNIRFYVQYCTEFTEEVYNALMEWCKTNSKAKPRGLEDNYAGLIRNKYFNVHSVYYGVDNNNQIGFTKQEYTIDQVKSLIGYTVSEVKPIVSEDYTGRLIKALVNSPHFTGVKLGETIKIIGKKTSETSGFYKLDKTSHGCVGMGIQCPLNTSEWELVDDPKQKSKVVPGYVRCVQALMNAKVGTVYPVVDEKHCLCEQGNTYNWNEIEFTSATKQEFDAQFTNEQDPLYICKQEYRKGMRVRSAAKTGIYSGEFIIDVEPKEFRNLSGDKDIVDYSCSPGYLYYKGEYAEILKESDMLSLEIPPISKLVSVTKLDMINYNSGIDDYLGKSGFKEHNPGAYNWLTEKPSIETVHSVDVNLRTKKQINKLKF
jgi:hypothetical protein